MKTTLSFLFFVCTGIHVSAQYVSKASGSLEMTDNPCITEICIPGIVWALTIDTATLILTTDQNWITGEDPIIIYGNSYNEGDRVVIYGQLKVKQDWNGDDYYEYEIVHKTRRDTLVAGNGILTLVFDFVNYECGINVFEHPVYCSTSELTYNNSLDTATYSYIPSEGFVGTDTIRFLTGCGYPPEYISIMVLEYLIRVTEPNAFQPIADARFSVFPNPSNGYICIQGNSDQPYDYYVHNLQGQRIHQGKFRQNITLALTKGIYLLSISDERGVTYQYRLFVAE